MLEFEKALLRQGLFYGEPSTHLIFITKGGPTVIKSSVAEKPFGRPTLHSDIPVFPYPRIFSFLKAEIIV
jgi:hypothetical protein